MVRHPNPNAPDYALRKADIAPVKRVVVRTPTDPATSAVYLTIVGRPVWKSWKEDRDILSVEVIMNDGTKKDVLLPAMGVMSFPDGRWSRNYTLPATE